MNALIKPRVFSGTIAVPASKSHTIRRLLLACLTDGISHIGQALYSADTLACAEACRILGAEVIEERDSNGSFSGFSVQGRCPRQFFSAAVKNSGNDLLIDAANSGTTLFFFIAAAALGSTPVTFTGDRQTAGRSAAPLLDALKALGIKVSSNNGCTPITVCGPWKGGRVSLSCSVSQHLSALLFAAPLAPAGTITEIEVTLLNEKPYVEMTMDYLKTPGLFDIAAGKPKITADSDFSYFRIEGGCAYKPINGPVPGDFSSAAFPAAAAVISGGKAVLSGLDPCDTQGDKIFFEYLKQMGCSVSWDHDQLTVARSGPLKGGVFDLNAAPDLLPVMAVLGAFAEGETALINAAHARLKETDRIAVMASELRKLFASGKNKFYCKEKPDGLIIQGAGSGEPGSNAVITLDGRGDHRVVMALSCAALGMAAGTSKEPGTVVIEGAEAANATYPGFFELLQ